MKGVYIVMISRFFVVSLLLNIYFGNYLYAFDCGKKCILLAEDIFFVKRDLRYPLLVLSEITTVQKKLLPRIQMFLEALNKKDIDTILGMHSEHFIDRKIYHYYAAMGIKSRNVEYGVGVIHLGEGNMQIRQKENQDFFKLWKKDILESMKTGEAKEKFPDAHITPYLLNLKRFQNKEFAIVITVTTYRVVHGNQYFTMRDYTKHFEDQLWFIVYFINKKDREYFKSLVFSLNDDGVYQIEEREILGEDYTAYVFWAIEYDSKRKKVYLKKDL